MFWFGIIASALFLLFFVGAIVDANNFSYSSANASLIASALFFIAAVICFK